MLVSHNMNVAAKEDLNNAFYGIRGGNQIFKINSKAKKQEISILLTSKNFI